MRCGAPWHAGIAHALGYMKGATQAVERLKGAPPAGYGSLKHQSASATVTQTRPLANIAGDAMSGSFVFG